MAIGGIHLAGWFAATSSADLLGTVYGAAARVATADGGNVVSALQRAERNKQRDLARAVTQPEMKRDIAAFRAAVARAGSAEALLRDPAAMKVLLTANGLGDHIGHGALARRALLSDVSDSGSLANRLPDARW